jgi:hypothetical protein
VKIGLLLTCLLLLDWKFCCKKARYIAYLPKITLGYLVTWLLVTQVIFVTQIYIEKCQTSVVRTPSKNDPGRDEPPNEEFPESDPGVHNLTPGHSNVRASQLGVTEPKP